MPSSKSSSKRSSKSSSKKSKKSSSSSSKRKAVEEPEVVAVAAPEQTEHKEGEQPEAEAEAPATKKPRTRRPPFTRRPTVRAIEIVEDLANNEAWKALTKDTKKGRTFASFRKSKMEFNPELDRYNVKQGEFVDQFHAALLKSLVQKSKVKGIKPRHAKSGYMLFRLSIDLPPPTEEERKAFGKNGEQQFKVKQQAAAWKALPAEQRAEWNLKAKAEGFAYKIFDAEQLSSAFDYTQKQKPDAAIREATGKKASAAWAALDAEAKVPYVERAKKELEAFEVYYEGDEVNSIRVINFKKYGPNVGAQKRKEFFKQDMMVRWSGMGDAKQAFVREAANKAKAKAEAQAHPQAQAV